MAPGPFFVTSIWLVPPPAIGTALTLKYLLKRWTDNVWPLPLILNPERGHSRPQVLVSLGAPKPLHRRFLLLGEHSLPHSHTLDNPMSPRHSLGPRPTSPFICSLPQPAHQPRTVSIPPSQGSCLSLISLG